MTINPNIHAHSTELPDAQGLGDQDAQFAVSLNRVRVRLAGLTVDIELNPTEAVALPPAAPVARHEPAAPPPQVEATASAVEPHYIRAPIVGTFYQAPEPGSAPFVSVGDSVTEGQQIGIVEAMKLMNRIDADAAGRVIEILVPDGTPVEYDQPMIALERE